MLFLKGQARATKCVSSVSDSTFIASLHMIKKKKRKRQNAAEEEKREKKESVNKTDLRAESELVEQEIRC